MNTKSLSRVQIKDADQGVVTAVFSTFDVIDKDGDVTRKGAFTEGASVVMSSYGHTSWDGDLPIGLGTIHETDTEAVAELRFLMDTTHGRDAFQTIKALSEAGLQEWSYSLQNVTAERGTFEGREVRFLNKIDVKEVSPVLVGAGVNTRTLAVKAGDMKLADHKEAVLTALKELRERQTEVVTLRAEQGKPITSARELLDAIQAEADALKAVIDEHETPPADDTDNDATAAFLEFVASSLTGVTPQS